VQKKANAKGASTVDRYSRK